MVNSYKEAKKQIEQEENKEFAGLFLKFLAWLLIIVPICILYGTIDGTGHFMCNSYDCYHYYKKTTDEFFTCYWPIPASLVIWRFIYCSFLIFVGWKFKKQLNTVIK